MTNNKQSSVEYFHDAVNDIIANKRPCNSNEVAKILLEAKAMHKLEIIQAMGDMLFKINRNALLTKDIEWCKQKYNEKFGGEK